ncbi:MAG: nuclear transport factor 2 family protein [Nocardioidaceae bacterium]|nr:nuclear transport factor 2 family protein [Nocardioidaceae bacterium]
MDGLLALEHDGWAALCSGRGAGFYGDLMTADGLMVLANGLVLDRDQVVTSLADAPPWDSYRISDPRLVDLGERAAALSYAAAAVRDGQQPFVGVMTSIYRLLEEGPRLALYQQTVAAG